MNYISDDKIEGARLEAKLGSFRSGPGISATDHLNGQTVPEYDKASDTVALGISDCAAMHKREMERTKAREAVRASVFAAFPEAPQELQSILYNHQKVEAWLAALAEKEQAR